MYPYEIFLGMDLYGIALLVGVISSFALVRIIGDKKEFSARLQNLILIDGFLSVVFGYLLSVVAQAIYNYGDTGVFEINENTGATFLGGLIGGAATFLIIYFLGGLLLYKNKEKEYINRFVEFTSIAGACISSAHAFGRIGCFFAGCCYGVETNSFLGVVFHGHTEKRLPTQLFESAFLFILCAVIIVLNFKIKDFKFGLVIYTIGYGIWRFFIEYIRGDDRGKFIGNISPSQFWSLVMVVGGLVMIAIFYVYYEKKRLNQK